MTVFDHDQEIGKELRRREGTLVDIQFRSPTGPWVIGLFKDREGLTFTATGNFGHCILFEEFILYGERKPDIDLGDFDVTQFTSMPPTSVSSLAGYLSSLTTTPRSSTVKLVQLFGEHTIDILERSPERLYEAEIPERDIERIHKGWIELRSTKLALAKVDIEGIPPHKLSKLQRSLGYTTDLNAAIKEDPYLLYIYFDDMLFSSVQSLSRRLGVPNDSESAVKGAVIATLRREAWMGHSFVEGKALIESCMKLLGLSRELIRPLIGAAVKNLSLQKIIHTSESRVQLGTLYEAERQLHGLAAEWVRFDNEDTDDIVPSEEMSLKLIKPMKLKLSESKPLCAGLRAMLGERFAIAQCETLADQITITRGLNHILTGFGSDAVFATYTCEMADEIKSHLGEDAVVVTYASLVGLDPDTGVPLQRKNSPISAEVVVLVAADALGIEEMTHILAAMPKTARLFLLGCPKDLHSLTVGQPFSELTSVKGIKAFQASFWLPARSEGRRVSTQIWTGSFTPQLNHFNPSDSISWLNIPREVIPQALPELLKGLAGARGVDPLQDARIVTPATRAAEPVGDVCQWLTEAMAKSILGSSEPSQFQGKPYISGLPIIIRQPVAGADHPAFSIFTPHSIGASTMQLDSKNRSSVTINIHDRIDVFPAVVMPPKFIRGRVYEFVILLVLKEHHHLINRQLISTLLNASRGTLVIAGEIEGLGDGFTERESSRARSKLHTWNDLDVD